MSLEDVRPLFDLFGHEFTLAKFSDVDSSSIEQAAHDTGVPLEVVRIDNEHAAKLFERQLVLIRPDQHVAWRGDQAPSGAHARNIIDRVRGA